MKSLIFAKRNFKEIARDPLSLVFCIGLPLFFLILFQQFKIPNEVYSIENFAPSMAVFGFAFISLFTGQLVGSDRSSSFLSRLYASPMKPKDYIIGYGLSLMPVILLQNVLFFGVACLLGLKFSINVIFTILVLTLVSTLFVACGILLGSKFNTKQVGGVFSLLINLVCFTSGMFFDVSLAGKFFKIICQILPFSRIVDLSRAVLIGDYSNLLVTTLIVALYLIAIIILSIYVFKKNMTTDKK